MRRLAFFFACLTLAPSALAAPAPDSGSAFAPAPVSQPLYGTQPPATDPDLQRHRLTAHDGVAIYGETWLPAPKAGNVPPASLPTVLIMTPYVTQDVERYPERNLHNTIEWFTQRGFAVTQGAVRGTGESGGCIEQTAANQIDDTARLIEYLGRDAPWSNGSVGMYGISYDGETQISTAGLGDPARTKYLKAIVPADTVAGQYEYSNFDGVPFAGQALLSNGAYFLGSYVDQGETTTPEQNVEKATCVPELTLGAADPTGDMTPFWQAREYRPGAPNVKAATLMVHGLDDFNVLPMAVAGFFDRLPETTPKAGLFGHWEHNMPDRHAGVEPEWAREDFLPMVTAWYDRYLKGLDSHVEDWPLVQVQDSEGQWRVAPDFPGHGGPAGQLPLGEEGLAMAEPVGSSSFVSGASSVIFETAPLEGPLHISGLPVLDLWLSTSLPTGQVTATLEVLGQDGEVLVHEGENAEPFATYGARSLRHLAPMQKGYFTQEAGEPPALATPLRVPVRFLPTDLVVPAGGKLRLTVGGDSSVPRPILPTGVGSQIEILHDCTHMSALRFLMPHPDAGLLNVREVGEPDEEASASSPGTIGVRDGLTLASEPACGQVPFDPHGLVTGATD